MRSPKIDWDEVAHNPILEKRISNGHAARMRYSRFRSSILGVQPRTRKAPGTGPKSKAAKNKTDEKEKKRGDQENVAVKKELDPERRSPAMKEEEPRPHIKKERRDTVVHTPTAHNPSPRPETSASNVAIQSSGRLMTPPSELDVYGSPTPALAHTPCADDISHYSPILDMEMDAATHISCHHDSASLSPADLQSHHDSWSSQQHQQHSEAVAAAMDELAQSYHLSPYMAAMCDHAHEIPDNHHVSNDFFAAESLHDHSALQGGLVGHQMWDVSYQ